MSIKKVISSNEISYDDTMITVKIVGQIKAEDNIPDFMMVEKGKEKTVDEIISKMHDKYNIPRKKYSKNLQKLASPFTGLIVTRNDEVVGMFTSEGYEPRQDTEQSVKDGDRIFFLLPAAGG